MKNKTAKVITRKARMGTILRLSGLMCACFTACVLVFSFDVSQAAQVGQEWITINKDYSSQRYVDLDQINSQNVSGLKEVCETRLNEPSWFSSGLLMVGRTLYVSTLRATYAIDAATCELKWRNILELGKTANIGSRGPGYLDGMIFRGTADGRVIALDAATGKMLWDVVGADPAKNESFVAAPIGWEGKVFIGIAISDLGIHGRLVALDAKTGKELWRFHTVPESPDDSSWKTWPHPGVPAGGGFWTTFSLDPKTGEVFGPVANPAPDFDLGVRPGDNLYTNSVIAVNAATGRLNWYFQITSPDDHDWDLGSAPTLYRTRSGKDMMAIAGKDGYLSGVDRATRKAVFRRPVTTILNNGRLPATQTLVCPGLGGGSQFNGAAYNPEIGALYVPEVDWCTYYRVPNSPGEAAHGAPVPQVGKQSVLSYSYEGAVAPAYNRQPRGWITALDGETGRLLWKYQTDGQMLAGLVPTKSGLVFAGDVRGNLFAFDAKNGSVLRHLDAGGAMNSGLISYAVDGTQYVAAAVGGICLNVAGVSGPLKVSIYGLQGSDTPKVVKLDRPSMKATGAAANVAMFVTVCSGCHGADGKGRTYPSLVRMTQLGDPEELKTFLEHVPPPMPAFYPGLLSDEDVQMIAAHLKSSVVENTGPASGYVRPTSSSGSAQWQAIYSVITTPRCMNCHTSNDFPRQSDRSYPHIYHVIRGSDDHGEAPLRCSACHGETNNAATGIPGSLNWHLAPVSMTFESAPGVAMTSPELCARLKDKSKTGGKDLLELLDHFDHDTDVNWAFVPGDRPRGEARTTPPLNHEDFVQDFKEWVDGGAGCPSQ
jgi:alcohol dehydrogenase (cytochrome c)